MTPRYRFEVPCIPVAQPRQRHRVVKTKAGGVFVANYTPTKDPVNAFKASVQQAFCRVASGPPLDCAVGLRCVFVFPRPASKVWTKKEMPREWKTSRPDVDNCFKAASDALNGIAWRDDSCIAWLQCEKVIASGIEVPHVLVEVFELGEVKYAS